MKNVNQYNLKTCIFLTYNEFVNVVSTLYQMAPGGIKVECGYDGLSVWDDERYYVGCDDFNYAIANYFGVNQVTSIHHDGCEEVGIWVCYKN